MMPVVLASASGGQGMWAMPRLAAVYIMAIAPGLIFFAIAQRWYMKGPFAGGHFNPGSKEHGYDAANGPHAGDMPNQYVAADGTLRAEVLNPEVTLADGEAGIRGRALMIHAGADDYRSQPSGDAGERLACAVIE